MASVLIIGRGSIGNRHGRLLSEAGVPISFVSRRTSEDQVPTFATIDDACAQGNFSHAIIATETSAHCGDLQALRTSGFGEPVLVEKPLSDVCEVAPGDERDRTWVAYNLRFHPVLQALQAALQGKCISYAAVFTGQHLDDWRPSRGENYSNKRALGGGVLRDLSHELDYIGLLWGKWRRLAALGGTFGALVGDTDDCWSVVGETDRCPCLSMHIDYLHRPARRDIHVVCEGKTIIADLVANTLMIDGVVTLYAVDRDMTYRLQLDAFLGVSKGGLCSFAEGLETVNTIAAIEQAGRDSVWWRRP